MEMPTIRLKMTSLTPTFNRGGQKGPEILLPRVALRGATADLLPEMAPKGGLLTRAWMGCIHRLDVLGQGVSAKSAAGIRIGGLRWRSSKGFNS